MATTNGTTNGVNGHTSSAHVSVEEFVQTKFDYIICGGGTAGLVIAARLSENPDVTVGVIEAGKNRLGDPLIDVPALFPQMLGNPEYDWNFKTVPQPGNKNKVHHISRGKVLGGSSGINYMMYVRGSDADYDDWAALAKDPSWSSENMKQYMRKHQTLEPIGEKVTDRSAMPFVGENHGTSGPVRTSFNEWRLPIEDIVIKAADEATGFKKKPMDPWSGDHIGFYTTLGLVARTGPNKGKRSYAARGYFQANEHRPNLKVVTESMVAKVILEDKSATGVVFINNGQRYTIKANREVVVCGGVIQSPQILELSGIGDPEVLRAAGVECIVDLPSVGNDLQDHMLVASAYELQEGTKTLDSLHQPEVMAAAQRALMETQDGPLTCISPTQGFFPAKMFLEDSELDEIIRMIENTKGTEFHKRQHAQIIEQLKSTKSANLQFVLMPTIANFDAVEDQSTLFPPPKDLSAPNGLMLVVCLQYPVARGYVHIRSNSPFDHPEIDPGYAAHPADVAVLGAGVKFLQKVANSAPLKDKLAKRTYPPPEFDLDTREGREASVRDWCISEYHPAGSCAMGSTVDSRLRVKGVKNLRVADASIFPNHVSGNIVSSVYALAEKAADTIKADWDHAALKNI